MCVLDSISYRPFHQPHDQDVLGHTSLAWPQDVLGHTSPAWLLWTYCWDVESLEGSPHSETWPLGPCWVPQAIALLSFRVPVYKMGWLWGICLTMGQWRTVPERRPSDDFTVDIPKELVLGWCFGRVYEGESIRILLASSDMKLSQSGLKQKKTMYWFVWLVYIMKKVQGLQAQLDPGAQLCH